MSALVIVIVIIAVVLGIIGAIGAAPLALVLIPIAILVVGWLVIMGKSRMRTGDVVRHEAPQQEFLGPGGPDDPSR